MGLAEEKPTPGIQSTLNALDTRLVNIESLLERIVRIEERSKSDSEKVEERKHEIRAVELRLNVVEVEQGTFRTYIKVIAGLSVLIGPIVSVLLHVMSKVN